jgi:hypothetical protein
MRLLDKKNSSLGIVIQFPIKKGRAPLGHPVLSLGVVCQARTSGGHPVLSLRTGLRAHTLLATRSVEQTLIKLQSTKLLVEQQSTKTPYLRFIGQDRCTEQQQEEGSPPSPSPPSPRGSSSNMSQDDDDFLDALINQNDEQNEEEEDGPLPVLRNIWECPMLTRTVRIDDNRKSFSGWSCAWCMKRSDGTEVPPFRGANATKALWHVLKEPGHDIRPCQGNIPRQKMWQYKELENSKALAKDLRTQKTASMMNNIQDLQDRTVLKMASGRASALILCAFSPVF